MITPRFKFKSQPPIRFVIRFERKFTIRRSLVMMMILIMMTPVTVTVSDGDLRCSWVLAGACRHSAYGSPTWMTRCRRSTWPSSLVGTEWSRQRTSTVAPAAVLFSSTASSTLSVPSTRPRIELSKTVDYRLSIAQPTVPTGPEKSWNLNLDFSGPEKSWNGTEVLKSPEFG